MLRRMLLGVGANAFGQIVTILIQLLSLPIFLTYWDASIYGTWLLLSALPAYLSMADIGMTSVAGNIMTMSMGRGEVDAANKIFQSAQLFMTIVCGALFVIVTPTTLLWPMPDSVTWDMRIALLALFYDVLFSLIGGLSDAVFKASDRYPLGAMLGQLSRLVQWSGFIVGLVLFHSFSGVAIVGCVARAAMTLLVIWLGQRASHGLRLGFRHAGVKDLKAMLYPALSFMAFALTNALSFQGITLLVGVLAGTPAVALFNTYRTLARVAVQFTSIFSLALWPEFAKLYGHGGLDRVYPVFRRSLFFGIVTSVAFSVALYCASPTLLRIWTHNQIAFSPPLMFVLLAYAAVGGFWHVPRVLLMSTNQHVSLSGWSIVAALASVALGWVLGRVWEIDGIAFSMLLSEAFIAAICIHLALKLFQQRNGAVDRTPLKRAVRNLLNRFSQSY